MHPSSLSIYSWVAMRGEWMVKSLIIESRHSFEEWNSFYYLLYFYSHVYWIGWKCERRTIGWDINTFVHTCSSIHCVIINCFQESSNVQSLKELLIRMSKVSSMYSMNILILFFFLSSSVSFYCFLILHNDCWSKEISNSFIQTLSFCSLLNFSHMLRAVDDSAKEKITGWSSLSI